MFCTQLDFIVPTQENLMQYVANYVRIFIMVILLTMYLRPKAILGVAAIVFSAIHHLRRINRMQRVERAAERAVENGHIGNNINSIMTLVVWVIVVYTKCTPILFLGFILASLTILTHAAVRQSPTEARYRGRVVLSYSFAQMLGRQSVPEGNDTWLVFKQLWRMWVLYMAALMVMARRWVVFYTLALWDVMRKPFVPALRSEIPSGWS